MKFGKKSLIVYTVKSIYVEGASRSERKRVPKLNRQFRRSFDYIGASASFWTARLDVTSNSLIEFWDNTQRVDREYTIRGIREEVLGNAGYPFGGLSAAGERSVLLLYE